MTPSAPVVQRPDVHLDYRLPSVGRRRAAVTLFALLDSLERHGSILRAARALGVSYRHVWGQYKRWEDELQQPLVRWQQGQPAQLTPLAERLLLAERRARERMAPHVEELRAELECALADAPPPGRSLVRLSRQ